MNSAVRRLPKSVSCIPCRRFSDGKDIFDASCYISHRSRIARDVDRDSYSYLRNDIQSHLVERLDEINMQFRDCVILGCWDGHMCQLLNEKQRQLSNIFCCDSSYELLKLSKDRCSNSQIPCHFLQVVDHFLPFKNNSIDLIISPLILHASNNVHHSFIDCFRCLTPGGFMLGALWGSRSLTQIKTVVTKSEWMCEQKMKKHFAPLMSPGVVAELMKSVGFDHCSVDTLLLNLEFRDIHQLFKHIQHMGESNCLTDRHPFISRKTLQKANELALSECASANGGIHVDVEVIFFAGWKPTEEDKQKVRRPQKPDVNLKDI